MPPTKQHRAPAHHLDSSFKRSLIAGLILASALIACQSGGTPPGGNDPAPTPPPAPPAGIVTLEPSAIAGVPVGGSCQLTATSKDSTGVSFSASDPKVIGVSASGTLSALGIGEATVTAKSLVSDARAVINVRVSDPASATLELGPSNLSVSAQDTVALSARASNLACATLSWTTSGGAITSEGLFTAPDASAAPVSVRLTATTGSVSKSAELPVAVGFWARTALGDLSETARIYAIAISPSGVAHVATDAGVYRLDPSSDTWQALRGAAGGLTNLGVLSLAFTGDGTLYAGTRDGVFRQAPGASGWQRMQTVDASSAAYTGGLPNSRSVNSLEVRDGKLYAALDGWINQGTVRAVYVYDPAQNRWDGVGALPSDNNVTALAWQGGALYAATRNGLPYRWDGSSWTPVGTLTGLYGLEVGPDDALYAARAISGDNAVYRWNGATWQSVYAGYPLSSPVRVGNDLLTFNGQTLRRGPLAWTAFGPALNANPDALAVNPAGRILAVANDAADRSGAWRVWRSPRNAIATGAGGVSVSGVTLQPSRVPDLRVGTNQRLTAVVTGQNASGVFWLSSNSSVAAVDAQGMLSGRAPGTATVTARARDDISKFARVTVTVSDPAAAIASVTIAALASSLERGATLQLRASLETAYFGTLSAQHLAPQSVAEPDRRVTWSTSNANVLIVSSDGLVSGVAPGTAQVTATSLANPRISSSLSLNVTPATFIPSGAGQWRLEATLGATPTNTEVRAMAIYGKRVYASIKNAGIWSSDLSAPGWRQETSAGGGGLPVFSAMTAGPDALYGAADGRVLALTAGGWNELVKTVPGSAVQMLWAQDTLWVGFDALTTAPAEVYKLSAGRLVRTGPGFGLGNDNTDGALTSLISVDGTIMATMTNGWVYRFDGNAWVTYATRQFDGNNSYGVRLLGLVADDAGNLYTSMRGAITKLPKGESVWRPYHRVPRAKLMTYSGDSIFVTGQGAAYQIKLSSGELVRLGANELPADHDLGGIAYDGQNKTVYVGLYLPLAGEGNLYSIALDPRVAGVSNDLAVTASTYLGGRGGDAAGGVDIAPDGTIVMAGRLEQSDLSVTPTYLLGGGAGAVVRLSSDGQRVLSLTRLGDTIQDIEINRSNGQIAVIGDFGAAVLSSDAKNIVWNVDAPSTDAASRVAIGSDGTVATLVNRVAKVYAADGIKLGERALTNSFALDIAIDANTKSVFVTGMDNKKLPPDNSLPGAPVQVAYLYSLGYDLVTFNWKNWGYSGLDLNGQEADTRGYRVSIGRDNKLYFLGENAGGNSIFRFDPRSPIGVLGDGRRGMIEKSCDCWVSFDEFNIGYNAGAAHFAYYARVDPATGAVLKGQFAIPRLPNTRSNAFRVRAISADERGRVYIGGISAYALENRSGQRVAGQSIGEYGGTDVAMLVVSEDFKTRLIWTAWNKQSPNDKNANGIPESYDGAGSEVVGFAAADGKAVIAARAGGGQLVTVNALQAAPSPDLSAADSEAFLGVIPMP